jgi:hypothetical protein
MMKQRFVNGMGGPFRSGTKFLNGDGPFMNGRVF